MTDAWEEFESRARGSECAGYFESAPLTGAGGRAFFFHRAEEQLSWNSATDPAAWEAANARFLRRHPRGRVIGYLSFDAVGLFEPLLRRTPPGSPFPLAEFARVARVEVRRTTPPRRRISRPVGPAANPERDSLPRARFERSVRRLKAEIRNGESYQVVLSHRREWRAPADLFARAGSLRRTERFAYFYCLRFGPRTVIGASPESVVAVRGRNAFVDPIAGTRPVAPSSRGRLPLSADPKELSEHRMLVDLARNDLGRIAGPGQVRLDWRERRVRYAHLEHLVSRVTARLRPRAGMVAALSATFPAGTVSGAPKVRATQLLRREEASWRGPYAGSVGWLDADGRGEWALAIRTVFATGPRLYTAAGAGVVHLSEPRREWDETLLKLARVESVFCTPGSA